MDSLDRAVDLARGSTSDFNSSCLSGNGLWNPDGSAFGIGGRSGLSLTGLGSVLGRGADSLLGTIGDLQIAGTLQSLASGLARSISSMAGAMFGILDQALSATGSVAQGLMGLAGQLVDAAARTVDLFSGAFQLAANGLTGLGGLDLGEVLSGGLGKLAGLAGAGLESLVGGVGSLLSNVGSLASDLMSHGIDALLSPMASLSQLSSLFSPITTCTVPSSPACEGITLAEVSAYSLFASKPATATVYPEGQVSIPVTFPVNFTVRPPSAVAGTAS
jgi:hypothetical protein